MHHFQPHAPACHHPGGNRAVDAAGQQGYRLAAHAHRQTAGALHRGTVDISRLFPDLYENRQVGMVNVHRHLGEQLVQLAAHRLGQLDGVQRIALVRPLALHLKGPRLGELSGKIGFGSVNNGFHGFFTGQRPCHRCHAEHLSAGAVSAVHVAPVFLGLHINGALPGVDLKAPVGTDPAADVGHQLVLKYVPVQPL